MDVQEAQREVRSVYVGGFWGQLVSSVIWLVSAALGTWVTPKGVYSDRCHRDFSSFCSRKCCCVCRAAALP